MDRNDQPIPNCQGCGADQPPLEGQGLCDNCGEPVCDSCVDHIEDGCYYCESCSAINKPCSIACNK